MNSPLLRYRTGKSHRHIQVARADGYSTLDYGFKNTGSTQSAILPRWRKWNLAIPRVFIEELAENASFIEVAYLLIYGDLPNAEQLSISRRHHASHLGARKHEAVLRSVSSVHTDGHAQFHDFKLEHLLSGIADPNRSVVDIELTIRS